MVKDLKEMVEAIQKMAAPPPTPPAEMGGAPARPTAPSPTGRPTVPSPTARPGAPAKPGTHHARVRGTSLPEVKQMQRALQELGQEVLSDSQAGSIVPKPKETIVPGATEPVKASKKGFADFIVDHFMAPLSPGKKGVEWTPDTSVTDVSQKKKTQSDVHELETVMDTMLRVGGAASEKQVDGIWGERTDNALRNVLAFANALVKLEDDFELPPNEIYSAENLKNFQVQLSGYQVVNGAITLPDQEKRQRANDLTKHLKALTFLYRHFRRNILMRSDYRSSIEGQKGLEKYKAESPITPQESEVVSDPKSQLVFTGPDSHSYSIPLSALTDKSAFDKYIADIGFQDVRKWAPTLLNAIKKQLRMP